RLAASGADAAAYDRICLAARVRAVRADIELHGALWRRPCPYAVEARARSCVRWISAGGFDPLYCEPFLTRCRFFTIFCATVSSPPATGAAGGLASLASRNSRKRAICSRAALPSAW